MTILHQPYQVSLLIRGALADARMTASAAQEAALTKLDMLVSMTESAEGGADGAAFVAECAAAFKGGKSKVYDAIRARLAALKDTAIG